ncbi:hypothetical protein B566_EDAN009490 [Ephemera danica]|nr:hypothetical protein B566_EDAN009490 [Ephemera danica]
MIMADSFVRSEEARQNEFTTDEGDRPLITQFAAKNVEDFVTAAEMVYPYCDGVDLNCGCPQRWAIQEGVGSCLLRKPENIYDLVSQLRNRLHKPFSVSVKIRLQPDIKRTVELCRGLERCGVTFVSVHARTPAQRKQPADHEALSLLTSACPSLPIVANGDVNSLEIAERLHSETKCRGVMSARAILRNPGLFQGHARTPKSCVDAWLPIAVSAGCSYNCLHHHLEFMLESRLSPSEKRLLHSLNCIPALMHFLENTNIFDRD